MYRTCTAWIAAALAVVVWFATTIHDFLTITAPVHANVLVVEGWVWDSAAMREAAQEFNRGGYDIVVSVGILSSAQESEPMQGNSAELAAKRLKEFGLDDCVIEVLAVSNINRHRTYTSALAVKHWLADAKIHVVGINVFTLGAHARKSLVLFKRAFGQSVSVGVIAGVEDSYEPDRWWLSARGIYTVLRKTIGYLYAEWWPLPDDPRASPDQVAFLGRNSYGSC
ncbi:MAG: hypothetical protein KF751_02250 [Nitrospira sp.]|nr:hypothetical protein [Nitrospira sp.]